MGDYKQSNYIKYLEAIIQSKDDVISIQDKLIQSQYYNIENLEIRLKQANRYIEEHNGDTHAYASVPQF